MKTIQTESGEVLLIQIPEKYLRIKNIDYPDWYLYDAIIDTEIVILYGKSGTLEERITIKEPFKNLKLLGKFSELKNKVFEEFVDKPFRNEFYLDYNADINYMYELKTAKESFQSLCKSQGIEDDLNNYLIIKKL